MFGFPQSYSWVPAANGFIPNGAIPAGHDIDNATFYIGRAFHEREIIPAKVSPKHGAALIAYNKAEHIKQHYEVLCGTGVGWKFDKNGDVPSNAIAVGHTSEGEPLYMGRAAHDGSLTPGTIHRTHGVLYIPFGGKEVGKKEYDVLVHI